MSVSHVVKGDGKVWPCVLGGVAAGAALAAVALHLMPDCFVPAFCKPRTRHAKVHVLLVQLGFACLLVHRSPKPTLNSVFVRFLQMPSDR